MSDYLWDRSGEPDKDVERLERLLGLLRSDRPAPAWPAAPGRPRYRSLAALVAAAAAIVALIAATWQATRGGARPAWEIASVIGNPKVGDDRISKASRLAVGEWLETDAASRASIASSIGQVQIEPNTRLGLLQAGDERHRLALVRGRLHASIFAPPGRFVVETSSAVATDLGCVYTLETDEAGNGQLIVTAGWVAFELDGRESFVPAGARCHTRARRGPGTPYFDDAPEAMGAALRTLDFGDRSPAIGEGAPLDVVLAEARRRDAITLWHLLSRVGLDDRERVYDRLAALVPPPPEATRERVIVGDQEALDRWWTRLGLGSIEFWRLWKARVK